MEYSNARNVCLVDPNGDGRLRMIQDIAPLRLANEYKPEVRSAADDAVLFVRGNELAVQRVDTPEPTFAFPRVGDACVGAVYNDLTYLFSLGEQAFWLAPNAGAAEPPAGFEYVSVHSLRAERRGPRELIYVAFTAIHLGRWYATTRFCGACGHPMRHHASLRAMECPSCGNLVFPRLNPAVIVCVRDPERNRIVITRYAKGVYQPIDALVAGFVEIGETIEECVQREVREELGLKITNISYYKSQPWGVAGDNLLGYWCDVVGDPTIHRDATELGSAVWASPEEIKGRPDDLSLTNEMMCLWRDQHFSQVASTD